MGLVLAAAFVILGGVIANRLGLGIESVLGIVAGLFLVVYLAFNRWAARPSKGRDLTQTVHYFRELGFLKAFESLTDDELTARLQELRIEEWGKPFDPHSKILDLEVLQWDTERVWWNDTELDVCEDNDVYVEVLKEWSAISRGAFVPRDIAETWAGEQGPVEVRFTLDGAECRIAPEVSDDWLDLGILPAINKLIESSGYQFETYAAFDQDAFVVVLTADEKRKIRKDRGWQFAF